MGVATWLRNRIEERACSFGIMKSEDESVYIYIYAERRDKVGGYRTRARVISMDVCIVDKERENVGRGKDMMEEGRMEEERSPSTCNIVITAWRSFIGTPAPLFIIHLESTGRDLVLLFWNKERVNPPSRSLLEKSAVRFVQDLSSTIVFFFKKILRREC